MSFFKFLRVAILLAILVVVAGNHWLGMSRLAGWERPIWITIYPILMDDSDATRSYVGSLGSRDFGAINEFIKREGRSFGIELDTPVRVQVTSPLDERPPEVPVGDSRIAIALWSLKMRFWAWSQLGHDGLPDPDIQVFVQYRKPQRETLLDRSVGIQKGRYALVNAYASRNSTPQNNIVIAHELLHVLGASDKYEFATGQPVPPYGLAEPERSPLYPQDRAEIMAGRIAQGPGKFRMPSSLRECVIGGLTAAEIGW